MVARPPVRGRVNGWVDGRAVDEDALHAVPFRRSAGIHPYMGDQPTTPVAVTAENIVSFVLRSADSRRRTRDK
jgi:hypothetical protein